MSLPLHADGCIVANIRTRAFRAEFVPDCAHTKTLAVTYDFRATDIDAAETYLNRWVRFPQMHLDALYEVTKEGIPDNEHTHTP